MSNIFYSGASKQHEVHTLAHLTLTESVLPSLPSTAAAAAAAVMWP